MNLAYVTVHLLYDLHMVVEDCVSVCVCRCEREGRRRGRRDDRSTHGRFLSPAGISSQALCGAVRVLRQGVHGKIELQMSGSDVKGFV